MYTQPLCTICHEPTKHCIGFADGEHDTHECIYDCNDTTCPVKIKHDKEHASSLNGSHNFMTMTLRKLRIDHELLTAEIANHLNISPAEYNAYETGQKPIPKDIFDEACSFMTQKPAK